MAWIVSVPPSPRLLALVQPFTDPGRNLGFDGLQILAGAAAMASISW
jgi:hypothetical protein